MSAPSELSDAVPDASGPPDLTTRAYRIVSVIEDVTRRRTAGEVLLDGQVIAMHPDLMPELGLELGQLRALRRVFLAAQRVGPPPEPLQLLPEELLDAPIEVPADDQAAAPAAPAPSPSPTIEGYQLLHPVGGGGQAVVYKAVQESTGRKVAVKVIPGGPFVSSRSRARFDREVEILAALDHPNIVGIVDRGRTADGSFFLVMGYVDGPCLDEHALYDLSQAGDVTPLLGLFAKLAAAIGAAHERGIVHRDLKPSNVRVDLRCEPHVLDFGLARWMGNDEEHLPSDQVITLTGQIVGSLPWGSPEQALGSSAVVDTRSDVYALGVMLYVALTGEFPYQVFGPVRQVLDNIIKVHPAPPSQAAGRADRSSRRREIPEALDAIVLKSLAKQPDERYATAAEFAADLQRHMEGHAVAAPPPRRRVATRTVFAVCATLAVITAAAIAVIAAIVSRGANHEPPVTVFELPPFENQFGMRFVEIPVSESAVGSPVNEVGRGDDERLQQAAIKRPYFLAVTEVTRRQYRAVLGQQDPPGVPPGGDDLPVTNVSWEEAVAFCVRLSELTGHTYRLPTEAEWESACRAGSSRQFSGPGRLDDMGWYAGNSGGELHPVGRKQKNHWGLLDMHGNAEEWCADDYRFVQSTGKRASTQPAPGTGDFGHLEWLRSTRGGSAVSPDVDCRSAARGSRQRDDRHPFLGFRLAREVEAPTAK